MSIPPPVPSSPTTRERMARQRTRDTAPEIALRRALHRRGLRFRVHRRPLSSVRATIDIVFGPARTVVRVQGCFWHVCPEHHTWPKENAEWWAAKLARNVARDERIARAFAAAGWELLTVWEHDDMDAAADHVAAVVRARRTTAHTRLERAAPKNDP
jgi:DNA mismatch endonuclease (patch repair protein)